MGLLNHLMPFGKDKPVDTRSALDRAGDQPSEGAASSTVSKMVENLLDVGIDGRGPFDSAQATADRALAKHGDVEDAIDAVVRQHLKMAGAEGFVTGLGGFVMLPIAMPANVFSFYVLATRMVASIAALRGYDLSQEQIRTAALLTLVGADADDLLAKAGVAATTGPLTNLAAQRLPGPALMVLNKAIGFRLLSVTGRRTLTRLGKSIPLAGGFVGAGFDAYLINRIAGSARKEFPRKLA